MLTGMHGNCLSCDTCGCNVYAEHTHTNMARGILSQCNSSRALLV